MPIAQNNDIAICFLFGPYISCTVFVFFLEFLITFWGFFFSRKNLSALNKKNKQQKIMFFR